MLGSLWELDIEIKDKKGIENVGADNFSCLTFDDDKLTIKDSFLNEHLFP